MRWSPGECPGLRLLLVAPSWLLVQHFRPPVLFAQRGRGNLRVRHRRANRVGPGFVSVSGLTLPRSAGIVRGSGGAMFRSRPGTACRAGRRRLKAAERALVIFGAGSVAEARLLGTTRLDLLCAPEGEHELELLIIRWRA